jgi:phospholipase C
MDSGVGESSRHDSGGADVAPRESGPPHEGGKHDGAADAGACGTRGAPVAATASSIKHVIVVVQENHSFDNYFSNYCTAATGSKPTCTSGPSCCETGPATDPGSGDSPVVQDDTQNAAYDPDHLQSCEVTEIDDGKMDGYVTSSVCGAKGNFAYGAMATMKPYWDLAAANALADNYFQPAAGASSENDMYLATASYVFLDDEYVPPAFGSSCEFTATKTFTNVTIADLLGTASVSWGWYGEGYDAVVAAAKTMTCPKDPMCAAGISLYPCIYDPSDDPFLYFKQFIDNPKFIFDYTDLACSLGSSSLPAVSYVKAVGYRSEHPGAGDTISAGETFVSEVVAAVQASPYQKDTLVLLTWDESGGYFDHVAPPADSTIDSQPYGPRIPLLAVGTFAKKNYISHVQMEHSSIVKFIEWNWLGEKTGQLGTRDTVVNNIGDMLDPTQTGTTVPAN